MKRLLIDFEKEGKEYSYRIYNPYQDTSSNNTLFASTQETLLQDLNRDIVACLQTTPHLLSKDKGIFQESPNWYYIHRDKINAYELTIQSLNDERRKLEGELQTLLSKDAQSTAQTKSD